MQLHIIQNLVASVSSVMAAMRCACHRMTINDIVSKLAKTAVIVPLVAASYQADGATVTQLGPVVSGPNYLLGVNALNDDTGATYNSLVIDTSHLFDQLAAYNGMTLADVIAQSGVNVTNDGNVDNGWNAVYDATGDIQITHISGIPGLSYDTFSTGKNMQVNFGVPTALAPQGITYGGVNSQFVEAKQDNTITSPTFYGAANNYNVVPEPSSLVLGAAGLGMLLYRRRRD